MRRVSSIDASLALTRRLPVETGNRLAWRSYQCSQGRCRAVAHSGVAAGKSRVLRDRRCYCAGVDGGGNCLTSLTIKLVFLVSLSKTSKLRTILQSNFC